MRILIAAVVMTGTGMFAVPAPQAPAGRGQQQASPANNLLATIKNTVRQPETAARNTRIAQLADQLDRLPDADLDTKIEGHIALETVDGTVARHATWLIQSAKTWDPARRKKYAPRLVNSYVELAEVLAQDGKHDEALVLLRRAASDLPDVPGAAKGVAGLLTRLELIGTPGAPLTAPRWLNMPPGTTSLDLKGKVTLIEFSAHWCGPCTKSYPALNRFRTAFGARGFQALIATELYGYFGADKSLTPDVELTRDRAYFAKHLPAVPVAIGNQVTVTFDGDTTTYSPARDPNHLHYRVGALPQFYLLDRQGRIRYVLGGYGNEMDAKLSKLIRALIAES